MPIAPLSPHMAVDQLNSLTRAAEAASVRQGSGKQVDKAYVQFEAFVLQNFVESMLPKDAESVFGGGTAGSMWKSMLAEKLGMELAKSGQLGIAQMIASARTGAQPDQSDNS